MSETLYRCYECKGTGMIEVDSEGHGSFRPCHRCRSVTFARWAGGHYEPGHFCVECAALHAIKGNGW